MEKEELKKELKWIESELDISTLDKGNIALAINDLKEAASRGFMPGRGMSGLVAGEILIGMREILGGVQSKKVLDIGCGAECSRDGWNPSIARILSCTGADVTGIDIGDSPFEPYKHITADLTKEKISDIVGLESKFDTVITTNFLDSPFLSGQFDAFTCYFENGKAHGCFRKEDFKDFKKELFKDIHSILKKEGIFFMDIGAAYGNENMGLLNDVGFIEVKKDGEWWAPMWIKRDSYMR